MSDTVGGFVDFGLDLVSGGQWSNLTGGFSGGVPYTAGLIKKTPGTMTANPAPAPLIPPELDPNSQAERDKAAFEERQRRLLGGRASTILTGGTGDLTTPVLGSATLLGQ